MSSSELGFEGFRFFCVWLQAGCYTLRPNPAMLGVMMILLVDMGVSLGVPFRGVWYSGVYIGIPQFGEITILPAGFAAALLPHCL